jgi:3D (Asp-Asp-Asp) domain-containing protein
MKRLIVTTAVAVSIATATTAYSIHERQVEQLQSKYEVQLNKEQERNLSLRKNVRSIGKANNELIKYNSELKATNTKQASKINKQLEQIKRQSEKIHQLEKQIDESPSWVTFEASAYTTHDNGDPWTSGKWGNKTASGTTPTQGRTIAVDRHLIPLGTKLLVKFPEPFSYLNGTYTAEDTGNGIKGHEVDLFLNNYNTCLQFGVRKIQIKIL